MKVVDDKTKKQQGLALDDVVNDIDFGELRYISRLPSLRPTQVSQNTVASDNSDYRVHGTFAVIWLRER